LQALCRLRSEPFGLERSATVQDLNERTPEEVLAAGGTPLDQALRGQPAVTLDAAAVERVGHGGRPSLDRAEVEAARVPLGARPRDRRPERRGELRSSPRRGARQVLPDRGPAHAAARAAGAARRPRGPALRRAAVHPRAGRALARGVRGAPPGRPLLARGAGG